MNLAIDETTETMARRLARLRGETVEQSVRAAIRDALAREDRAAPERLTPDQQARVERTMALAASLPPLDIDPRDPTGFLYDEYGLPA